MYNVSALQSQLNQFTSDLNDIGRKQIPFATALALTWTAKDIKAAERKEMGRVFDNPTNFTLNGLYISPATKKKLNAKVWFKDWVPKGTPAAKYLQPQVKGGDRRQKRYEKALQARGFIRSGQVTGPGAGARLNRAGNITQGQINRMLNSLHSQQVDSTQHTVQVGNRTFFAHYDESGFIDTIYIRNGRRVKPFLHVFDSANYEIKFKFYDIAEHTFNTKYKNNFKKAFRQAMATRNQ